MSKVIIRNIGPIIEVEIELNRINVVIGPQSSGKSTIAKVISFCQWVEKRFILDGKFEYDFEEQFIKFHRIGWAYFREDSFFCYESEFISIQHIGVSSQLEILRKENEINYLKSKNIYIPAERNFVSVIPNLRRYNETNDNIISFVYDWYDAKKKYVGKKTLPVLDLGVTYAYLDESDADVLKLNGVEEELHLKNASSGLQSVIPLVMLIDYLTGDVFDEKKPLSVNEKEQAEKERKAYLKALIENIDEITGTSGIRESLKNESGINLSQSDMNKIMSWMGNRSIYYFTNFIVEEPEQNLFPATQRDLVYYFLEKIAKADRSHSILMTTHSPYILYAINNCLMGGVIQEKMPLDEQEELKSKNSWVDPALVSVWEIKHGRIHSIIDARTRTVTKHYFNEISNEIMDEYYEMLNYFEYDNKVEG
jgi:predicted ATP-dependent endonuclease of OLD family